MFIFFVCEDRLDVSLFIRVRSQARSRRRNEETSSHSRVKFDMRHHFGPFCPLWLFAKLAKQYLTHAVSLSGLVRGQPPLPLLL